MNKKLGIWISVLFLTLSVVLLVFGGMKLSSNIKMVNNGISTQATIIELRTSQGGQWTGDSSVVCFPVVEFSSLDGKTVRSQLSESNKSPGSPVYAVGGKLDIIYTSDNPEKAIRSSTVSLYGVPLMVMGLGILAVLPVAVMVRKPKDGE